MPRGRQTPLTPRKTVLQDDFRNARRNAYTKKAMHQGWIFGALFLAGLTAGCASAKPFTPLTPEAAQALIPPEFVDHQEPIPDDSNAFLLFSQLEEKRAALSQAKSPTSLEREEAWWALVRQIAERDHFRPPHIGPLDGTNLPRIQLSSLQKDLIQRADRHARLGEFDSFLEEIEVMRQCSVLADQNPTKGIRSGLYQGR